MSDYVFTSDLSIDEILLVEEAGFEPLELVQGSSYYHIGWASAPWASNMELGDPSRMMLGARQVAMARLLEQAAAFRADGVVGMRLRMEREAHHAEFIATGTAVRKRAGDGAGWRDRWGRPFTCDLSGADFWALVRAGYRPVMLAHGVCVYHIAHKTFGQWLSSLDQSMYNQENAVYTQALYDARELAMARMQWEAHESGATAGVVAVDLREESHGWGSHILELVAVGTGIAPIDAADHATHETPKLAIVAQD
jgi:uncharacterized protein YbjQ (UPF0145 family)